MADDYIDLASYESEAEAAIVRGMLAAEDIEAELSGTAMASWFWHYGTAIGGVRLMVRQSDAERARTLIDEYEPPEAMEDIDVGDAEEEKEWLQYDFETYPPEPIHSETEDLKQPPKDEYEEDEIEALYHAAELRAWRAAVISILLCPPLLNIYSMWVLLTYGFLDGPPKSWRVAATIALNLAYLGFLAIVVWFIFFPSRGDVYYHGDGEPIEMHIEW